MGQSIYASDDHADMLFGVVSGQLALRTPLVSGEEIIAHIGSPGFWLGVTMIASREKRRHLAASARTDVMLAFVPLSVLRGHLQDEPQWWFSIARLMEQHWSLTACLARDLMLRRHRDRLVATVLRLAGLRPTPTNPAPDLRVPVTHHDIAVMANCSPSFVHAELRRMQARGWIELAYGNIRVREADLMQASLTL